MKSNPQQDSHALLPKDHFAYQTIGVSNTEAQGFGCERAWLYAHHPETKLAPKSFGAARSRGIAGHKALEIYYRGLMEELPHDEASQNALDHITAMKREAIIMSDLEKTTALSEAEKLCTAYFEWYEDDAKNWEVLGVETFYVLRWEGEDTLYLPIRLDTAICQKSGDRKGEIVPVDHKFTKDFWTPIQFSINSQLPLQIRALQQARFKGKLPPIVNRGIINQIRTGASAKAEGHELFRRSFIPMQEFNIDMIMRNHLKIARRIERLKRQAYLKSLEETTAKWGSYDCKYCDFKSLCIADLHGEDVRMAAMMGFDKNEYGYPPLEELTDER